MLKSITAKCATVAQLVEQLIRNQQVAGSSPASSSSSSQASYRLRRVFYASHQKLIVRSFCCSSLPNRIRCAGFRFGLGHEISGLKPPDTSEQALYRLLRFFSQSEGTQIFFGHVHPTCPDGAIAAREETAMARRGIYVPGKNGIRACASCLCGCLPGGFVKKL